MCVGVGVCVCVHKDGVEEEVPFPSHQIHIRGVLSALTCFSSCRALSQIYIDGVEEEVPFPSHQIPLPISLHMKFHPQTGSHE